MRYWILILLSLALVSCSRQQVPPVQEAGGWISLFDGTSLDAWRGFRADTIPPCWGIAEDGTLHCTGEGSGDLITREQFADFILELEWKISPCGNSGIMYRVTEEYDAPWKSGPEMQVLDNACHPDGASALTSAGACYGLYPPMDSTAVRPAGEWNQVRIVVDSAHVEHWLNGKKVVEYELWSDDWNRRVAQSKFREYPDFGKARKGHIVLQNHGDPVWYRNIRIQILE